MKSGHATRRIHKLLPWLLALTVGLPGCAVFRGDDDAAAAPSPAASEAPGAVTAEATT